MELQELSPALLQPQVTAVATLGELLATLPRLEEMVLGVVSTVSLYSELEQFTKDLWSTLCCFDDTWRRRGVTSDGDNDAPTFLSHALATYESSSWITWDDVTVAASEWQGSAAALGDSWARLARKATKLHKACREVATKLANVVATATARARELQGESARGGTAQENMVELGQALGGEEGTEVVARHEAQVRREARVAAREADRATVVRQRVKKAVGLLECLVAACDEATAFPRELQCRVGDIRAALEGTNEAPQGVPEHLVAQVAVAERLWETNAHLAKGHLLGTLDDIIRFYSDDAPIGPSACVLAERCQRAIEDIPRLVQPPGRPKSVTSVSPVTVELQQLASALLQPQVTVVAILGELLATLPRRDEAMLLFMSSVSLYEQLEGFSTELRAANRCIRGFRGKRRTGSDPVRIIRLSEALAVWESSPWITWDHLTKAASEWQGWVDECVDSWAQLAMAASELHNTCREEATKAADIAAAAMARARALQDKAARDGTAEGNMVGLGLALGREEGTRVVAGHEAQVRRQARAAAREAARAAMVREQLEAALGPLECLVAACDKATAFPRELQRRVGDIRATLEGTNEAFQGIPEDLVDQVAVAEQLWVASVRLAKGHLLGTLGDIKDMFSSDSSSSMVRGVTEKCQKAIEDIPSLLYGW